MHETEALRHEEKAEGGEKCEGTHHDSEAWVLSRLEPKGRLKELEVFE
jgi:hypothetical protein